MFLVLDPVTGPMNGFSGCVKKELGWSAPVEYGNVDAADCARQLQAWHELSRYRVWQTFEHLGLHHSPNRAVR